MLTATDVEFTNDFSLVHILRTGMATFRTPTTKVKNTGN